jgi:bifunctional DNA-binding transcriptional regulator/antitoxin component of YhaV-PrlF toxin-antitoxin module
MGEEARLIALASLFADGTSIRGKIPVPLVKALKAKGGDVLAFEQQSNGRFVVRKSTAAERKTVRSATKKGGGKK